MTFRSLDDDTCKLPREIGDCKEFTERWYYDEADEECRAFLFGGAKAYAAFVQRQDTLSPSQPPSPGAPSQ